MNLELRNRLLGIVEDSVKRCRDSLGKDGFCDITLEVPLDRSFGDFATNVAMALAGVWRMPPRKIAESIVGFIERGDFIDSVEVAGPGFINFRLNPDVWRAVLVRIESEDEDYGRSNAGGGKRVQVEFVSANPTGPVHIGNGRGAAVGNCLANLLDYSGYQVQREFYLNDAGRQVEVLGRSVERAYKAILGLPVEEYEEGYKGDYIKDLAREIYERYGENCDFETIKEYSIGRMIDLLKQDMRDMGVEFDVWFSERELHKSSALDEAVEILSRNGYTYNKDGALWFRSTDFGDERDRVLLKSDGSPTYLVGDIAYHLNKYRRGFDKVIDILGANHQGQVPSLKAAVEALGCGKDFLDVVFYQWVRFVRGGERVKMSKRAGDFVALSDLVNEVGRDAVHFFYLMRSNNSPMDFDLDLAKKQSDENPVYYVQYAHARVCNILKHSEGRGIPYGGARAAPLHLLNLPEELSIIKQLSAFDELILGAARTYEPHRITRYLLDLCQEFHSYYNKYRVVGDDPGLTQARLALVNGLRIVLRNGLKIAGVSAPESM
ncbi:MAG: arginine--tRNA ligase [bacterium]